MRALGLAVAVVSVALATASAGADPLGPEVVRGLESSPYVYIATQRKDGGFGAPAEIWFMWERGAVWVASPATTWRVKRIRAGRPAARIAVGTRGGPQFLATGSLVEDPAVHERLFATFAKKYPEGWQRYEARFREGLRDGSRVLMRYDPTGSVSATGAPTPAAGTPRPTPRPS